MWEACRFHTWSRITRREIAPSRIQAANSFKSYFRQYCSQTSLLAHEGFFQLHDKLFRLTCCTYAKTVVNQTIFFVLWTSCSEKLVKKFPILELNFLVETLKKVLFRHPRCTTKGVKASMHACANRLWHPAAPLVVNSRLD